jgi:hypothetical protein
MWKINGARQAIYGKSTLSVRDRHKAAEELLKLSTPYGQEEELPLGR